MSGRFSDPALRLAAIFVVSLGTASADGTASTGTPGDYIVRAWTVEDGLPENTVSAVLQTRDGYLWLGTYGGLARFDGVRFSVFNNSNVPEMRDNAVTALFQSEEGTLWIGHESGKLTRLRSGQFEPVNIPGRLELGKLVSIASDEAGDVWVMNSNGQLARVRDGRVLRPRAGPATNLLALTRSPKGRIWVTSNGLLFELFQGELEPVEGIFPAGQGFLQGVCASGDGGLWVAQDRRLRKWKNGRWVQDLGPAPWGAALVHQLIETETGELAAATVDWGLFLAPTSETRKSTHLCRTNGFASDWITSVYQDHEGGLWAGTGGAGLLLLRERRVQAFSPPDQWQGRAVLSVSPGSDGSLWIGTEGAGLYRYRQETWENFGQAQNLHPYVWSAVEDAGGTLWMGTWGAGLFARRNGQFEKVSLGTEPPAGISAVLCSRNGGLWVGTEAGLVRYDQGQATWYRRFSTGQPIRRIRAVAEQRAGGVWFGSLGDGLGYLKDGEIHQYRKRDGLASDFIECLYEGADGVLWIGTQGAGVCRLKQGHFTVLAERQGLPSLHISAIEEDGQGCLWMSSRDGIIRAVKGDVERCLDGRTNEVPCVLFGPWDGLPAATCSGRLQPAVCKTTDGRLWFPTTKGLAAVDPQTLKLHRIPPPIVMESLSVDERVAAEGAMPDQPIHIPPGHHRFEFDYTGLSFVAPERVRFKYRLEGLETDWVDAGAKRSANYSYIPPGSYAFRVTACSSDGVWNPVGATVAFQVTPYFWQTTWFSAISVLGLVAVTGGFVWWDSRRRTRRKLEQSERQRAIEQERSRIARDIHDDLGAHLTRITMLSESAGARVEQPEQMLAGLSQIYTTARELTRAMDETVWAVNPKHDSLEGLANYLEKFALDHLAAAGIDCQLDFPLGFPEWTLTSELRHNVFLAFKEAVNNLVKHAHATKATVRLTVQRQQFELVVQDNGRGFVPETIARGIGDPDRFSSGNGLENLRRRLARVGGACEIRSGPAEGTRIVFLVPVG